MSEEQEIIAVKEALKHQQQQQQANGGEESVSTFDDLIAGGVAGTASVVIGHPFDTIKVRLQSQKGGERGSFQTKGLFKGMGAPMVAAASVNAVIFGSYGYCSRFLEVVETNQNVNTNDKNGRVQFWNNFVSGSFAGLVQCLIICPTEHIKCRLQTMPITNGHAVYKGPLSAAKTIYKKHGIIDGIYRGWWVTVWREVPAFGLYFAGYDLLRETIVERLGKHYNDPSCSQHEWLASGLAGGLSGCLTWALVYPFDVIKTNIQTGDLNVPRGCKSRNMWHVGMRLYREKGLRMMFRGLGVTLIRAFPVNGIIFPVYEFTLQICTGQKSLTNSP